MAVVTGALGQLGQVYAAGLAERGMRVASFDVATGALPDGVRAFEVDVTDRASIAAALEEVVGEWGVPHLLVNNAALDSPPDAPAEEVGPFEEYPEAAFDAVLDVNVKGTLLCCQVVGAAMAKERRGSIVNVSSVYGLLSPPQDLYEFRRTAGRDVLQARRLRGLEGGGPEPHALPRDVLGEGGRARQHAHARGRVERPGAGVPRRVRDCARRWAGCWTRARRSAPSSSSPSDASSYVTGSNVVVDGGWSAW